MSSRPAGSDSARAAYLRRVVDELDLPPQLREAGAFLGVQGEPLFDLVQLEVNLVRLPLDFDHQ